MIHKTTRSILSVLLAVLLLVTSIPLTPAFADGGAVSPQSESAEGRALEPADDGVYQIATANDLREFAQRVNGGKTDANTRAELTANIDLSSVCSEEKGTWTPIGNIESTAYTGTFDGNGKTISGLYISSNADYRGLFGYVGTGGTVQNLSVSGSVSGGRHVGGVVGYNDGGRVENCYNTGSVTSSVGPVGGVVGYNSSIGSVKNCYNTGSVTSSGSLVGGVVGYNDGGSVTNSYNTGDVTGGSYVGGVVGDNSGPVKNCYNTGSVTGTYDYVGGVVGSSSGGSGSVTDCYFLKQDPKIPGIGDDDSATGATGLTADQFKDQNSFTKWDFGSTDTPGIWEINATLNRPVLKDNHEDDGSKDHPYEIFTATQLENFRDLVNDEGGNPNAHAKLMNDIDLEGNEKNQWTPIGSISSRYTGTFNGNGHKIENLYINTTDSGADNQGLFGGLDQGGTVQNLTVSGNVSGDWHVGGVVGYNNGGTVTGCIFSGSGSVSGGMYVGGVVGYNNGGTVTGCTFSGSGTVTGSTDYVGGVVGHNYSGGSVTNCYNIGNVSGNNYVGGVVGDNRRSVENCYNTGTVTGTGCFVGGVVGDNYLGASVENCYNTGTVTGFDSGSDDNYVGGVVGQNSGTVENCYNTSSVSGGNAVGGVVGLNDSGIVENCYNTGTVTGTDDYVGGVVGHNGINSSVTNCYFLSGTADNGIGGGSGTSSNVEARTADAFHSGEVAWRLQAGQKATGEEDPIPQVWGQSNLNTDKSWPTLVALDKNAQPVYQVTFDYGTSFTDIDERYDHHYANANDNVILPTSTDPIPSYEGHTLTGWQNEDGQAVTEPITVTADITFTAQWTKDTVNYTVTVTTSPAEGGTVNGGGTFAEGTQVTVTATANDGYTFVAWQEDGEKIEGAGASYTFTVNDNCTLTAIFEKEPDPTPIPTPTPDPKPSGPSTGDSTGWDDIRDELENAENGDEITIDMGDETKVPAEIFESLAGQDITLEIALEGGVTWTVNGQDIPADANLDDLDLGVEMDSDGIPVDVVNAITGERDTVQMTLAHDGDFGFTMTLTAPLGAENAGYWANLYHYDEDAEQLTFETAAEIDADGSVSLSLSHASQYAIVIDTYSHATVDVSDLFIDIAPDAWYKDAVQYAYDNGLMTGVSATEFAPEATTTRAMIVSILARLENVTTAEAAGFADVDDNDWYATAVNWAANVGVVNGYEDNTFKPNTAITREQLAAILMNYAAYKGYDVSARADLSHYSDADSISSWANDVLLWAVAEGLLTGVTDDTIAPQAHATRAQVAAILQRFLSE